MAGCIPYSFRGANFRIRSSHAGAVKREIRFQRRMLTEYIGRHREFMEALQPVALRSDPPEIVRRMDFASYQAGVGPMACVAGATAQLAAEAAVRQGAQEAIVENGGDIYLVSETDIAVGLYIQGSPLSGRVAFRLAPSRLPVAVCSSSGRMGRSRSFGDCDLAAVLAEDAALADGAATRACNWVKGEEDIRSVAERIAEIVGVQGIMVVRNDRVALAGDLPELVKSSDDNFSRKITIHPSIGRALN